MSGVIQGLIAGGGNSGSPSPGTKTWSDVAINQDGSTIVLTANTTSQKGNVVISTNGGMTWSPIEPVDSSQVKTVSMSQDSRGILVPGNNISFTKDMGASWQRVVLSGDWRANICSGDFSKLAIAIYVGILKVSVDGGVTWTDQTAIGNKNWTGAATSLDGMFAYMVGIGFMYKSTDGFLTWSVVPTGNKMWFAMACSADGSKLAGAADSSAIQVSSDYGVTWVSRTASGSQPWRHIGMSADGNTIVAAPSSGYVHRSADNGVTWSQCMSIGSRSWSSVSVSGDGLTMVATSGTLMFLSVDGGVTWVQK